MRFARAVLALLLPLLLDLAPALAHAFDEVPASRLPPPASAPAAASPERPAAVLTRAPELKRFVEASYPAEALAQGLGGDVAMLIDIGADGAVQNVEVVRPAGYGFDEAAVAAVRQFEFAPAELDGVPAAVRIAYTYHFVMTSPPDPASASSAGAGDDGSGAAKGSPGGRVTMRGRVLERGTRLPIPGATVRCTNLDEAAVTDARGSFALHPPAGACEAAVVAAGYEPFARHETIGQNEELDVSYFLMPRERGLFQTVVHGERDQREATRRTLTRDQLQSVPGSFGDPVRVVQDLPGVARAPFVGGQLAIRGASPADSGAYMDGVEIPLLFHFLGGPSVVNPEFLDRLDFLPGGFGPRYGRAVGGIVEADTRRGDPQGTHGSFKLDLIDSAAFLETPASDKLTFAVAARRSYIDALLPSITPSSDTGTISVLPRYWDYQVRADYGRPGDAQQVTVMAFGSDDQLSVAATGGQADRNLRLGLHTDFHRLRVGWTSRAGALTNTFAPYVGRDATGFGNDSPSAEGQGFQGTTWAAGLRDEVAWDLGGGHTVRFGTDFALSSNRYRANLPVVLDYRSFPGAPDGPPQPLDRRTDILDYGFYNEWGLKLTRRLSLVPGVRLDQYVLRGRGHWATDPRVSARYKLTDSTVLKGSLGLYSRAPDATALDPQLGNPNLGLVKAVQSSLGVEQKLGAALGLDVTGFYNRRYDMVVGSDRVLVAPDGTLRPEYFSNDGLGRAYGVEVLLRHEITAHFFGWIAYTLSRSEVRTAGAAEGYQLTSMDETHILTTVGQYRLGNGWAFGARFQLVSGRPVTPILGAGYDADSDRYVPSVGTRLSERNPLFQQLDLRVDREWLFEHWRLGAYLDVQNVYWAKNVEAVQWDYRYQQKVQIPGVPLLPTLGVKGSF